MAERLRAVLVVLTSDAELRESVVRELERRYGRDYAVVAADGREMAAAGIGEQDGLPVAVLLGGLGGADPDGLTALRELHRGHSSVKRVASAVGEGALAVTLVQAHLAATVAANA
jgi:thioredoxin reductase (NADPH)